MWRIASSAKYDINTVILEMRSAICSFFAFQIN